METFHWKALTQDPWVLEGVSRSADLDFHSTPLGNDPPAQIALEAQDAEVKSLLAKRAIGEIEIEKFLVCLQSPKNEDDCC